MTCTNITPVSYADSKWVAAWLPIKYQIRSDKWPVNTFDTTDNIASVADNYGYAKVTLTSTYETYVEKEYIKITGSSVDSYNGVWQILQLHSSTVMTLSAAYDGNDSAGQFQRYYNNYHVLVRVYTGIRSAHPLYSDNPITLKGTVKVKPDSNGDAWLDISSYVRADLSPIENNLCDAIDNNWHGNDTKLWTSFYIAYAESYDSVDTSTTPYTVTTTTSSFTNDTTDGSTINYYWASNSTLQFQNIQGRSIGEFAMQDTSPEDVPAKWMTTFTKPTYFFGEQYDVAIISAYDDGTTIQYVLTEKDSNGNTLSTETQDIDAEYEGVYRFALCEYPLNASTDTAELYIQKKSDATVLSETVTIKVNRVVCRNEPIYLRWLNPNGGYDSWQFQANKDLGIDVLRREIVRRNIFNNWDDTFVQGDTQDDYYDTEAYRTAIVRSQVLTQDEAEQMKWLRTSNKVYEVFTSDESGCTRYKQITVLIDPDSFTFYRDGNKVFTVEIAFRYTDQVLLQGQ